MISETLKNLFLRSSLFRFVLLPATFVVFSVTFTLIYQAFHKNPYIESVSPAIAEPGDVIVIRGRHFGPEMGDSYVEIGGDRLSMNAFLSWTDTLIMATVPFTVQDGLVHVKTGSGKSNPVLFANKNNIPVFARSHSDPGTPVLTSFDTDRAEIGKRLTITGRNFGLSRSNSTVNFVWQTDPSGALDWRTPAELTSISCSEHDFDYEFWSDQEIRVRVPDGARSGQVFVKTERGISNTLNLNIVNQPGVKKYTDRRTYLISAGADFSGIETTTTENTMYVRMPIPDTTASQRNIEVTASTPVPFMNNYRGTILHQFENLVPDKKYTISHNFVLTVFGTETSINAAQVRQYSDTTSPLYTLYTMPDPLVPSDNEEIVKRMNTIVGREKNPWRKAELIFTWLTTTIEKGSPERPNRSVQEALLIKSGDDYDMAILFTAMARSAGIPAVPVSGILIDSSRVSRVHWWAEIYIESFGWVPVDPGLGRDDRKYFGSIDANRVIFSRGWTDQKPMMPNSKTVYIPRSWAFMPIWEEAAGSIKAYTSFWSVPRVTGIY